MNRAFRSFDQARRSWYMGAFQIPWLPERVLSVGFEAAAPRRAPRRGGRALCGADGRGPGARMCDRVVPRAAAQPRVGPPVHAPTTYVWGSRDPSWVGMPSS